MNGGEVNGRSWSPEWRIVEWLRSSPEPVSFDDLCRAAETSMRQCHAALVALRERGLVIDDGERVVATPARPGDVIRIREARLARVDALAGKPKRKRQPDLMRYAQRRTPLPPN